MSETGSEALLDGYRNAVTERVKGVSLTAGEWDAVVAAECAARAAVNRRLSTLERDAAIGRALRAALESLPDGAITLYGERFATDSLSRGDAYLFGTSFRNTEIRALLAVLSPSET